MNPNLPDERVNVMSEWLRAFIETNSAQIYRPKDSRKISGKHMNAITNSPETRLADIDAAIEVLSNARCISMDLPVYGLLLDLTYQLNRMRSREVA